MAALVVAAAFGLVQSGRVYLSANDAGPRTLFVGMVGGICGLYLFAWLLRNFARWFGGGAPLVSVRVAIGLALLPWTLLFGMLIFAVTGAENAEHLERFYPLFFAGFVYGYVILLLALAAALQLSVLRAFFCLLFTALVSYVPLALLVEFASLFTGTNP